MISRDLGQEPAEVKSFYLQMASGSHKFTPGELSALTDIYKAYEPHLSADEKVMTVSGILAACARSTLAESNGEDLGFFIASVTKVLIMGSWSMIDKDPNFLQGVCKALREVVIEHLPLLPEQAIQAYFCNSRRFTRFSRREQNNGFRLHSDSDVFDDLEAMDADACNIPNQALMAVIFHFCKEDGPIIRVEEFVFDELADVGPNAPVVMLKNLADCLNTFASAGHYLPIKLPDLVVVSQLIDRFALAASFAPSDDYRDAFIEGVSSLVDLVLRNRPEDLISKDINMFLVDAPGFQFYDSPVATLLEKSFLQATASQIKLEGAADQAVQDLHRAVIRNSLQVHGKHYSAGYDNQHLIAGLLPNCNDRLKEPGSLSGFKPEQQALVVCLVADPVIKKRLLVDYKSCRGQVLTNDLGM